MRVEASASTMAVRTSSRHTLPRQAQSPKQQLRIRNLLAIASPKIYPHVGG
jgi:hypothetical protein